MQVRPIPGHPGYFATDEGQIIGKRGRPLKPRIKCPSGHLRVGAFGRTEYVHRYPANNRPENLRWDTRSANIRDAVKNGTASGLANRGRIGLRGERNPSARLTDSTVRQIEQEVRAGRLTQRAAAAKFGVALSNVNQIVNHKRWKYLWE